MSKQNIEGFLSNPFFVALKTQNNDSKFIELRLMESIKRNYDKDYDYPYQTILDKYCSYHKVELSDKYKYQNDYLRLIKETILEYLLEEDCLKYFLDNEEESEKFNNVFKRKQFNSKLIKTILNRVASFMSFTSSQDNNNLSLILFRDIKRKIAEFNNNYVIQEMGTLKTIVDKVTSGVKTECYLEFGKGFSHFYSEELANYIFEKHGYKYTQGYNSSEFPFFNESDDKVLSLAVVNDESFWIFSPLSQKTLLSFAHLIVKHNGIRHAQKLIDYAFERVCEDRVCKYLYDNKLNLYISLNPEEKMLTWCLNRLTNRLKSVTTREIEESDYEGFLYPLYNGYDLKVQEGKKIFTNFIKKVYSDDAEKIFQLFENLDNIIQESLVVNNRVQKRRLTIKTMLEAELFGYDESNNLKRFMYGYHKDFGTKESILGRMYYRCFIINKLTGEVSNECLYEIFFDILNMINFMHGTKCSYIVNHDLRNEHYFLLKDLLKIYGFKIDDSYKEKYITALLDRKYASFEEVEMFPQLEQLGDAIYELAVDNILFYNPNTTLDHSNREKLVKADAQIKVSKKIGLNKLYISNLHHSLNSKYLDYEKIEMGLHSSLQGNYIADSLEMIIGALSLEFGLQRALDFTTKIILEANSDLKEPKIESFDIVSLSRSSIDKAYLSKIYPCPFRSEVYYDQEYSLLGYALGKLLKICIIGNETKEKRQMISNTSNQILPHDEIGYSYTYVVTYLYYGIEATIEKYRSIVESSYKESK
ncbi:MAG: hypothetical protein K2K48_03390 [Anaeroplasmataceae bacterium]|nr:hypothetical protein [Anaeroplasmataceae bacterium]